MRMQACDPVFQTPSVEASALDYDMHRRDGNHAIHNIYIQASNLWLESPGLMVMHIRVDWRVPEGQ